MLKLKFQYLGHLIQRTDSLENTLMLGKIEGRRRRGRQSMRWLDGITDSMDMSLSKLQSSWWTGRPGMVQSMGSQRVRHDWAIELKWYIARKNHPVKAGWFHFKTQRSKWHAITSSHLIMFLQKAYFSYTSSNIPHPYSTRYNLMNSFHILLRKQKAFDRKCFMFSPPSLKSQLCWNLPSFVSLLFQLRVIAPCPPSIKWKLFLWTSVPLLTVFMTLAYLVFSSFLLDHSHQHINTA